MKLARLLLAVDDVNQTWVEVPPWEATVLQAVWGSAVVQIETGASVAADKPSAHKEYARLNRRYGVDRDGNEYVAQTYGNEPLGVHTLNKAIQDDGLLDSLLQMAEQAAVLQENPDAVTGPSPGEPTAAAVTGPSPGEPTAAAVTGPSPGEPTAKAPAKKRSRAKTDPLL